MKFEHASALVLLMWCVSARRGRADSASGSAALGPGGRRYDYYWSGGYGDVSDDSGLSSRSNLFDYDEDNNNGDKPTNNYDGLWNIYSKLYTKNPTNIKNKLYDRLIYLYFKILDGIFDDIKNYNKHDVYTIFYKVVEAIIKKFIMPDEDTNKLDQNHVKYSDKQTKTHQKSSKNYNSPEQLTTDLPTDVVDLT